MNAVRNRFSLRALTLIAALAMSIGIAACGDSDDGGSDGSASASSTEMSSDERGVRAALTEMSSAMKARDFKRVCAIVTPAVRKQALTWEDYPTCAEGMADALTDDGTGTASVVNSEMPRIAKTEITGDKAVVSAKRGQKPLLARVEKVGDEWLVERWFSED